MADIVTNINMSQLRGGSVSKEYPNIIISELNDTTPLVVTLLAPGDIPLIALHNGEERLITRISSSAYNIDKLLRTTPKVRLCCSAEEYYDITSIKTYLEVASKWISHYM